MRGKERINLVCSTSVHVPEFLMYDVNVLENTSICPGTLIEDQFSYICFTPHVEDPSRITPSFVEKESDMSKYE